MSIIGSSLADTRNAQQTKHRCRHCRLWPVGIQEVPVSVHERRRSSSSWSWSSSSTSSCSDRAAGLRPAATGERETASRIPMWPRDDLHVRDRDVQFVGCRRCLVGFWRPAAASSGAAFSVPDACTIPSLQSSRRRVFACFGGWIGSSEEVSSCA